MSEPKRERVIAGRELPRESVSLEHFSREILELKFIYFKVFLSFDVGFM